MSKEDVVKQWFVERGFKDASVVIVPAAQWQRCAPSYAAPRLEGDVIKHRDLVCELGRRQPTRWTAEGVAGLVEAPVLYVSFGSES